MLVRFLDDNYLPYLTVIAKSSGMQHQYVFIGYWDFGNCLTASLGTGSFGIVQIVWNLVTSGDRTIHPMLLPLVAVVTLSVLGAVQHCSDFVTQDQ